MISMSTPKEFLSELIRSLAKFEESVKEPLVDAGFPDIPMPAEFHLSLIESLPEIFPLPKRIDLEIPTWMKTPSREALMVKRVLRETPETPTSPTKITYRYG